MAKWIYREQRPRILYVEDASNDVALVQQLRAESNVNLLAVRPDGSKEVRATAVTALFESGRVLLPERAHWVDAFIDEMCVFPNGRHDDQVDACVFALRQLVPQYNAGDRYERNTRVWRRLVAP